MGLPRPCSRSSLLLLGKKPYSTFGVSTVNLLMIGVNRMTVDVFLKEHMDI
ncbi:MAG: hypothetical protein LBB43_03555 [Spirochaetaceae bacterium]|nr:hypothetical protein [Spirochaetaceae bacterium]